MKTNNVKIVFLFLIVLQVGMLQAQNPNVSTTTNKKFELRPNSRDFTPIRHSNTKERIARKPIMTNKSTFDFQKSRPEIKPNKSAIKNQIKMLQKRRQAITRRNFRR